MKQIYMLSFLCALLFTHVSFSQSTSYHDALDFDGNDDRVTIQHDDAFDFAEGTVEAWVQPKLLSGANMIILGNRGSNATRYSIHMNANTVGLWNGDSYLTVSLTTPFRVGAWYHVAAAIGEFSTDFYVDGEYVGTTPNGMGAATGLPIQIGNTTGVLELVETYNGTIDEVKFWNGIRTAEEIKSDMYDTTNTNASLVAYYKLNESSGTTAADATGNARTGTLYNFALTGDRSNWTRDYTIGTPVALDASEISDAAFTANWEAPAGDTITSYILDVATDLYFTNPVPGYMHLNVGNVLSFPVIGLNYSQTYYYRVRAIKEGILNAGPYSNTVVVATLPRPAQKLFVDANAMLSINDGTSWESAFISLDDALINASYGDTIWVAKGTYQPREGKPFYTPSGVKIFGGFEGTEGELSERKLVPANVTILAGNGAQVISNQYITNLELDGFTITGGSHDGSKDAPGDFIDFSGAGMYNYRSSAIIRNCTFTKNYSGSATNPGHFAGGAVYNESSTVQFINCVFEANQADDGGAMANAVNSNVTLTNCVFSGNSATNIGGAICNSSYSQVYTYGGVFYGNSTTSGEGNVEYNYSSYSLLSNCTVTKNYNTGIGNNWLIAGYFYSTVDVYNSIMVDNAQSSVGLFSSATNSGHNLTDFAFSDDDITGDPKFLNAALPAGEDGIWGTSDDGLQLTAGSDAINKGDNSSLFDLTVDIMGNARIQEDTVDIGGYESSAIILPVTLASFKAEGNGCSVKLNWVAAQETSVQKYTLEKSIDGIRFTTVADVNAGNASGASYAYSYNSSNEGTLYFRLKITDRNGAIDYSAIEKVSLSCQSVQITMTPNPVKNVLTVANLSGTSYIQVYSASGQQVVSVKTGSSLQSVSMASLPSGIYVVRVMSNNKLVATQKVMKY